MDETLGPSAHVANAGTQTAGTQTTDAQTAGAQTADARTPDTPTPDAAAAVQALARASRLLERAATDLSLSDFRVLSAINSGDERASRVADRLAIGRPSISAAVDSLGKRGLLVRSGVDHDQRAAALALTAEGAAARQRMEDSLVAVLEGLCARTPDPARVIESLAWLGAAIESGMHDRDLAQSRATTKGGPGTDA
jgi:DNA-binding MarR family transcriptional regulator